MQGIDRGLSTFLEEDTNDKCLPLMNKEDTHRRLKFNECEPFARPIVGCPNTNVLDSPTLEPDEHGIETRSASTYILEEFAKIAGRCRTV